MKIISFMLVISLSIFAGIDKMYVSSGWNLKGVSVDIKNLNNFLNADIVTNVYVYRDGSFIKKDALKEIKAGDGFWIFAKKSGWLDVNVNSSTADDSTIPTPRSYNRYIWDDWYNWSGWEHWGFDWHCENNNYNYCNNNSNVKTDDISLTLAKGWNLKGSSASFRIRDVFNSSCVKSTRSVVIYKPFTDRYYKFDKNSNYYIMKYNGFWVEAKEACTLKHQNNSASSNNDDSKIPVPNGV